jgi:glycosyltransferase involved in cell wall biosynthesis
MPHSPIKLSILIPAYNEDERIVDNLKETCRIFKEAGWKFEIIVVDDGSRDQTLKHLKQAAKQFPQIKVKRHFRNFGKGRTLKFATRFATGEYIAFLDADLELHPRQIFDFFKIMEKTKADVVVGSKWHPDSVMNYPPTRGIISRIYYFGVKLLFGLPIRDTQTGLKLFKANVLKEIFPLVLVKKYAFDLEILVNVKRRGYRMAEAPVEVLFRRNKLGRIGWRDLYKTMLDTLAIFYRLNILKYYDLKVRRHH